MSTMNLAVIVSVLDRATAPLRGIAGGIAALAGIAKAATAAGELGHDLEAVGITADMTGAEVLKLRQRLTELSAPTETNQSVRSLTQAYEALVSAGMDKATALEALPAIGKAATATRANITDLAKTSNSLITTLNVPPGQLAAELDRLAQAGKAGKFELKDMAQHFPALAPLMHQLGITGTEAVTTLGAALQVAAKGTGDNASAATNMINFLSKVTANDAVKNFEKIGLDIRKVMADAVTKGENPFEVAMEAIEKAKKKNPHAVNDLFGDMQVQQFLLPMLQFKDTYAKIKAESAGATGVIAKDYDRMMQTFKERTKAFGEGLSNIVDAVGFAIIGPLGAVVENITPLLHGLAGLIDRSPATVLAITGIGVALAVLPPVIGMVRLAWTALRTMGGLSGLVAAVNPLTLALAGIALVAGLVIDNWGAVKSFLLGFWPSMEGDWAAAGAWLSGVFGNIATAAGTFFAGLRGAGGPALGWLTGTFADIAAVAGSVFDFLQQHWRGLLVVIGPVGWAALAIIDHWQQLAAWFDTFTQRLTSGMGVLWDLVKTGAGMAADGLRGAWEPVVTWLTGIFDWIAGKWQQLSGPLQGLSNLSLPNLAGGMLDAAASGWDRLWGRQPSAAPGSTTGTPAGATPATGAVTALPGAFQGAPTGAPTGAPSGMPTGAAAAMRTANDNAGQKTKTETETHLVVTVNGQGNGATVNVAKSSADRTDLDMGFAFAGAS